MAITINGTGTITGISAGGLPDGVITSDDLANNAVTAGKLATTLDLSSSTITLPSGTGGKILQVVNTSTTNSFTNNTTTFQPFTSLNLTITPSSTSSRIIVVYSTVMDIGNSQADMAYSIQLWNSTSSTNLYTMVGNTNTASGYNYGKHAGAYSAIDSPNSTSAQTYQIRLRNTGGGGSSANLTFNTYAQQQCAYAMEVG